MRGSHLPQILSMLLSLLMLGGCQGSAKIATMTAIPPSASPTTSVTAISPSALTPTITSTPMPVTKIDFTPSPYQGPLPEGAKAVIGIGAIDDWEVSPNGSYLAVLTSTNLVSLYDAVTWEKVWFDIARSSEAPDRHSTLQWSPDDLKIGLRTPTTIFVWDAKTGRKLHRIDVADHYPESSPYVTDSHYWESAEWSPNSEYLALGSIGILIIDVTTGAIAQELSIPGENATALAWSIDGTKLRAQIDEESSCRVIVWNVENAELIQTIDGECTVAWTSDFRIVVTTPGIVSSPTYYNVRNVDSGQNIATSDSKPAISPNGTKVAVNNGDTTHIVDIQTGSILQTLTHTDTSPKSFSWSPDSSILAVASFEMGKVWNINTGQLLFSMDTHFSPFAPAWSFDNRLMAVGSPSHSGVTIWSVETGTPIRSLVGSPNTNDEGYILFLPGSTNLLQFSAGNTLGLWNSETGEVMHQVTGSRRYGLTWSEFAWSQDSSKVALMNSEAATTIWDVSTGMFLEETDSLQLTDFVLDDKRLADDTSPDGSRSVSTEHQEPKMTFSLWNAASNQLIHQIPFGFNCEGPCVTHRWSPDSQWLAVGDYFSLQILRADTGAAVNDRRPSGIIETYAFSPDSKLIAAEVGGAVIVWEVP